MPSFTSSSDMRSRDTGWFRTLAIGLLLAMAMLGGWEIFWRMSGFTPVIEDDLGIWAVRRQAVQNNKDPSAVLLGASRIQLDVDPMILQAETNLRVTMLAIDGSSPLPVLDDLARNSNFDGLVLCSLLPQWLADGNDERGRSAKWVGKFHKQKWSFWIETRLSLLLQSLFVFRYPGLLPNELREKFLQGQMPRPPYAPMRDDRYRPADYTRTDIAKLRAARIRRQREIVAAAKPLTDEEFAARISEIDSMVRGIQERGGSVIFLRLPSTGETLDLEEKTWPRAKYWDRFAERISARTLHFADYPGLSGFDCPDGSHLDYRDAKSFTRALADVLALRGENQPAAHRPANITCSQHDILYGLYNFQLPVSGSTTLKQAPLSGRESTEILP